MRKLMFNIADQVCDECALALRRFIGHMDGIASIDVEEKKIVIVFDNAKITDDAIIRLTTDSLDKLGHKQTGHWHLM
jgi:copper chaperone CopZ